MAGPTPVSALIHAATMVVAGVYLGARVYSVFWEGFSISAGGVNPMALIGGITILIGAALAFVQDDIKKVLAYSTISQLGYMVMGLGVGAWVGAVFHLFTHAFFKALLFLGAGSVSHSGSHHSFDMKKDMGGLRKYMPITFVTFMIGSLALAGVFPLAGFWSKDEILATAGQGGFEIFTVVGLVGAVLTAAYMTRCVYLTFFGEYRGHGHPHESPRSITGPLDRARRLQHRRRPRQRQRVRHRGVRQVRRAPGRVPAGASRRTSTSRSPRCRSSSWSSSLGVAAVFWLDRKELRGLKGLTDRSSAAKAGHLFLVNKYYLDDLYEGDDRRGDQGPDRPGLVLGQPERHRRRGERGRARASAAVGRLTYRYVDQDVVDGAVNGIANETGKAGGLLTYVQSGARAAVRARSSSGRSGSSPCCS